MASLVLRRAFGRATQVISSSSSASVQQQFARHIQTSAVLRSADAKDAVEKKLTDEVITAGAQAIRKLDPSSLKSGATAPAKVTQLADQILTLNLLEAMQLSEVLKTRLGVPDTPMPFGAPMMMQAAPSAPAAAAPAASAPAAPPKEEKTHVDIKLKAFKAENKIKVIKEVRAVTNLGLKEAKDLVESAPCTLMAKVKKEDAVKILEKLKTETGAELELV